MKKVKSTPMSVKAGKKMGTILEQEEFPKQLRKHLPGGGHIVQWIACLDVLEPDGERVLYSVTSDGMTEWQYDGIAANVPYPYFQEEK